METLGECPICRHRDFSTFLKCLDYTVSHETFQIEKCQFCDLVFTNPRPDHQEIDKYYKSDAYISHSNSTKGLLNFVYQKIRSIAIKSKVNKITALNPFQKSILDYGSGTGEFLKAMKAEGWNCQGIEPSLEVREMSKANYKLDIENPKALQTINEGKFGVITLWHVLEHIHDLKETVYLLEKTLGIGGFIIIAVPNRESWDADHYNEYWAGYDVPRHLYHFSKKDILSLFGKLGLKLIAIHPMFYDPFYISILSEKYKNGKTNYLNAFINGIKITIKGRKEITQNSSLVYIFQKANN